MFAKRLATIVAFVCITASAASSAVPPMISYQGKLMQSNGTPVPDGNYSIRFAIYDAPTGGDTLWSETNPNVQVKGGLFAVMLGSVISLPADVFDGHRRYFGIKVGGDSELTPRQQVASVAFAVKAGSADLATTATTVQDSAITTTKLASNAVTQDKIADVAVTTGKIADQAILTEKIADEAISLAKIKSETWQDYTPVWSTEGDPQPSGGTTWGRYTRIGKTVIYRGELTLGPSATMGTGRWMISLPVPAAQGPHFGVALAQKYNTGNWAGVCYKHTSQQLMFRGPDTGYEWTPNVPYVWTPGSYMAWEITYEAQ